MLNIQHKNMNSPVRTIKGKAELYNSSAISATGEVILVTDANAKKPKAESNVAVKCLGKNLFDYKEVRDWGEIHMLQGDHLILVDAIKAYLDFYPEENGWLKKGYKYTFSQELLNYQDPYETYEGIPMGIEVYYTDGTNDKATKRLVVGRDWLSITTDANKDIEYLRIIPAENNAGVTLNELMLTIGNASVVYEEYKELRESINNEITLYTPYSTVYTEEDTTIKLVYNAPERYLRDFTYKDALKGFKIERVGENKFFGFGICQKLSMNIVDRNREIEIYKTDSFFLCE